MSNETSPAVNRWFGIKFATAARFEPPVRVPFAGVPAPGGTAGPIAPQTPGMLEQMFGQTEPSLSEDCLSLNVFSPADADPGSALPVLHWIHGGAYVNGSGSSPFYEASNLAARGHVVVTVNYRLGALGFLGSGNWGTLDQICGLEWVRDHIGAFGGDAGNVTIFGESAGGSAVLSLMASPQADGLFHRVVAQSPSIRQLRTLESANDWAEKFFRAAGVDGLEGARALSVEQVLEAQGKVLQMRSTNYDMFTPAGGGDALPHDILSAVAASPVPLLMGTTRDESRLFTTFDPSMAGCDESRWQEFLQSSFGERAGHARSVIEAHRPEANHSQLIAAVQTEHAFRAPAIQLAERRAALGNPTWKYWFTFASTAFGGVLGSCHALDIPFVFDNATAPGTEFLLGDGEGRGEIADRFAGEVSAFAKGGAASWPAYDTAGRATLRIDHVTEVLHDPESPVRELFS
ncbi:MAG: carboxylesterase/lipase family protein [Actinomycetota bacterium]